MIDELVQLTKSIDHIKEIVATQQSYAGNSSVLEPGSWFYDARRRSRLWPARLHSGCARDGRRADGAERGAG